MPLFLGLSISPILKAAESSALSDVNNEAELSEEVVNKAVAKKVYKQSNVTSYEQLVPSESNEKYASLQPVTLLKADRLSFNVGAEIVQNETYYSSTGALIGGQYFFDETWGLSLAATVYSSTPTSQTNNLKEIQAASTDQISALKNKLQADLYFVPFYGKWSFAGQTIIPFELYLKAGVFQVTNQFTEAATGFDLGIGQIVPLNSNSSIDLSVQLSRYKQASISAQDRLTNSVSFLVSFSFFLAKRIEVNK